MRESGAGVGGGASEDAGAEEDNAPTLPSWRSPFFNARPTGPMGGAIGSWGTAIIRLARFGRGCVVFEGVDVLAALEPVVVAGSAVPTIGGGRNFEGAAATSLDAVASLSVDHAV